MKLRLLCAMTIALCPWLMAPAAVTGSLSGFSGGSPGGQSAGDWGIPKGDPGGSQGQGTGQSSTQSSVQAKGEGGTGQGQGQGSGQSSTQNPNTTQTDPNKGEPNEPTDGQDPKGEPNEPTDGQDPKGEPNEPTNGQDAKGEPNGDGQGDGGNGGNGGNGGGGQGDGGNGGNGGDQFPSLGPDDNQYDPGKNEDDQQLPSGCAEAGSACAQCVQRHEAAIQFNRRYLHVAWSTTHQTLEMANKALAFGDTVSGIHSTQGLAWQLGGRPQIEEAVADLRKTYAKKYREYVDQIDNSLRLMSQCEQDNFAIRDLYERFGFLYLEFIRSRYESPD